MQIFIKIDLKWVYHQIRIKEGNKWKRAFRTSEELFKPIVLQFGFTNTPAIFQKRINSVLKKHLNEFIIAYLDNIIIYSDLEEEHKKYVKWVLKKLHNKNIPIAIEKCEFHTRKTDFIKFIIELGQISMNPKKIEAIVKWKDLKSVTGLRLFLRFCNYYRRFIANWLHKTESFTKIIKKNKPWNWNNQMKELFQRTKRKFTEEPILKIY